MSTEKTTETQRMLSIPESPKLFHLSDSNNSIRPPTFPELQPSFKYLWLGDVFHAMEIAQHDDFVVLSSAGYSTVVWDLTLNFAQSSSAKKVLRNTYTCNNAKKVVHVCPQSRAMDHFCRTLYKTLHQPFFRNVSEKRGEPSVSLALLPQVWT